MNRLLSLQARFLKFPFGRILFSKVVARMAPYFTTIRPIIQHLAHNQIEVSMQKRRAVHNHLKTVHAIACCNLCEFAAGICMEASIPKHRRWIPTGMDVKYLKKAKTDLVAKCDLSEVDWERCQEVVCDVPVFDNDNQIVVRAKITMKVSDKPKR